MRGVKNGIILGDSHCGHKVGLTPPNWQFRPPKSGTTKRHKWYNIARQLWNRFDKGLQSLPILDFVLVTGDLIDGKAEKSGGTELLTGDVQEQCDMAIAVFKHLRQYCRDNVKIVAVYGTDYHVATQGEDWENEIAYKAGFDKIGAHEWVDVNGLVFDLKHKVGSSAVPHGRYTALAKQKMWNLLWAEREEQPKADVLVRGHAHYYSRIEDSRGTALIAPALQGMGSRFGSRQCIGTVDWGFVEVQVKEKYDYTIKPHISTIRAQKAKVMKV